MRQSDFEAFLLREKLDPVYFLFSTDAFLLEEARQALAGAVEAKIRSPLSRLTVDLDDVSVDELLNSAQSFSMFSPCQLIFVKGVMKLRENQTKKLASYLASPNPHTFLIFLAGNLDRDQRKKKIFEILSSGAKVVELASLEGRELMGWIEQRLALRGFSIEPAAADFLLELQGNDLGRLYQELEKATLYAGAERRLTLPMLEVVSGFAASHTLAEFVEALTSNKERKALSFIDEIFFKGRETGLSFWWFGQQLRQWLQFNELAGKTPATIIGKQVGVYNPTAAARMMNQSKQFSRSALVRAIDRLAEVDDKMKSSCLDTRLTMELLVHDLTRKPSSSEETC
jgi:DNA polymerase III subunit delta